MANSYYRESGLVAELNRNLVLESVRISAGMDADIGFSGEYLEIAKGLEEEELIHPVLTGNEMFWLPGTPETACGVSRTEPTKRIA